MTLVFTPLRSDELEDCSYTLSMDCKSNDWISFHDWIPDFQFSDRNRLYSVYDNRLYVHNEGLENEFYGTRYESSISPVLVSPKETLERKESFILDALLVKGSKPSYSWSFNNRQTTGQTNWELRDESLTLSENYELRKNCYFDNNYWQFNYLRNIRKLDSFYYNRRDRLFLIPSATEDKQINNRIVGDHLITQLTFISDGWWFGEIGFAISWMI